MRSLALALALLLIAGCSSFDLPEEFLPLERMREGSMAGESAATTIGTTVYVQDLERWEGRLDEPRVRALILHERVHSVRQLEQGLGWWLWRYLTSTEFAWAEEQLGWAVQIRELRRLGQPVNPEGIAAILANYKHPAGDLVSYDEALAWVNDVITGRWKR